MGRHYSSTIRLHWLLCFSQSSQFRREPCMDNAEDARSRGLGSVFLSPPRRDSSRLYLHGNLSPTTAKMFSADLSGSGYWEERYSTSIPRDMHLSARARRGKLGRRAVQWRLGELSLRLLPPVTAVSERNLYSMAPFSKQESRREDILCWKACSAIRIFSGSLLTMSCFCDGLRIDGTCGRDGLQLDSHSHRMLFLCTRVLNP